MAVEVPPNFLIARDTLMPPPPGSNLGSVHLNFLSGIIAATVVLLSMQGLKVMVTIAGTPLVFKKN